MARTGFQGNAMNPLFQRAALVLAALLPAVACAFEAAAPVLETYAAGGAPSSGPCAIGDVSRDGRFVTFSCASGDLLRNETNPYAPYRLDRRTREVQSLLVTRQGQVYESGGSAGFVSDDGRYLAFNAEFSLHPDVVDPPSWELTPPTNAYLRDVVGGVTYLLGRDAFGRAVHPRESTQLRAISFPRQLVVFLASMNLLDPLQPWTRNTHLYLRNWNSGALELINARPDGGLSEAGASLAELSPDGRYVAFLSGGTDLGNENPTGQMQLFLRDRVAGATRRLSFPAGGGEFAEPYRQGGMRFTDDGRSLILESANDELASGSAPGFWSDIYRVDVATRHYELISTGYGGQVPDSASFSPDMSADGRYVAFFSRATNLLSTPQARPAVYVKDLQTGEIQNVSAPLGDAHPYYIPRIRLAGDASSVLFDWRHPDAPGAYGRVLIYSVALRGTAPGAPAAAQPVPALRGTGLLLLGAALALAVARCFSRRASASAIH